MCSGGVNTRRRRDVSLDGEGEMATVEMGEDLSFEVFSGIFVDEEEEASISK